MAGSFVGVQSGYVRTSSEAFGDGLVFGATIVEGSGLIGFGISADKFGHSRKYEENGANFEVETSDFLVTILATFNPIRSDNPSRLILGVGPQVHFLNSRKFFLDDGISVGAKASRLGLGLLGRYQRRSHLFGSLTLTVSALYSWVEEADPADPYTYVPPEQAFNATTLMLGLAYPF
jgi:hypothetical protein